MKFLSLFLSLVFPLALLAQEREGREQEEKDKGVDTSVVDTAVGPVPPMPFLSSFVDSLSFDNILHHTPMEFPTRPGLGNLGLDSYPLLPKPSSGTRIGHRLGALPNPYASPQNVPNAFDVRFPITRLEYSMGSQEEQFFTITHTQNVTPRWNIGVRFRKFGGPGFYRRQKSNFGNFLFSTNYREAGGHYQIMAAYQGDRSRLHQNGGIQNPSVFEQDQQDSREALLIRLDRASSRSRYDRAHLKHAYFPSGRNFENDAPQNLRLGLFHHGRARSMKLSYEDKALGSAFSFYPRVRLDSSRTRDRIRSEKLENKGGLLIQKREAGTVKGELRIGYTHREIRNELMGKQQRVRDGIAFVKGALDRKDARWTGKLAYGLDGRGKQDQLLDLAWVWDRGWENVADSLGLAFQYKKRAPAYLNEHYRSNHFRWEQDLPKARTLKVRGRLGEPEEREGLSVSHTRVRDAVFFGTDAEPKASSDELRFARAQLRQRFRYQKWGLDLHGAWQKEWNSDILRFPEFYLKGELFFETPLFQHALTARFGARCRYYSAFKGYAYMPVTRRFYLQNGKVIGDYPFIDLYVHGRVGDILFFVEMDHGNAGLMGYEYYGAPRYPLRDRMFRAGFKWNIYN